MAENQNTLSAGPGSDEARAARLSAQRASRSATLARLRIRVLLLLATVGIFGLVLHARRPYAADFNAPLGAGSLLYVILVPIGTMRTGWPSGIGLLGALLTWGGLFAALTLRPGLTPAPFPLSISLAAAAIGTLLFILALRASRPLAGTSAANLSRDSSSADS